jgi:cytochrome b involved in lipid metabolism
MKYLVIAFLVIIAGTVSGYYLLNNRIEDIKNNNLTTSPKADESKVQSYVLHDIEKHSTSSDCWFSISGVVYDLTKYIKEQKHPGKDAILQGCGKDATELYNTKAGRGEAHSENAHNLLNSYKIGVIVKEATPSGT